MQLHCPGVNNHPWEALQTFHVSLKFCSEKSESPLQLRELPNDCQRRNGGQGELQPQIFSFHFPVSAQESRFILILTAHLQLLPMASYTLSGLNSVACCTWRFWISGFSLRCSPRLQGSFHTQPLTYSDPQHSLARWAFCWGPMATHAVCAIMCKSFSKEKCAPWPSLCDCTFSKTCLVHWSMNAEDVLQSVALCLSPPPSK